MYRTFRALRGCRPVTFDRTGAACAKLPPGTGAPHRESPRPPAQPPIPAHTKNRPPCRFFGGLPPVSSSAVAARVCRYRRSRYCSAISSASRASQVSSPTDPSPSKSRSAHRHCGPRTHTDANPESDNVCHSCSPTSDPMPPNSTATHRTDPRNRPASPTSNTRTHHRALCTTRRRSLCARAGGVREDRYQASRSVRRRIGSARTNARTRMRDI